MANPASPCWQLHGQDADGSPPQARLFRKRLPAAQLPRLEAEVEGLAALAPVAGELVLPRVLGWGLVAGGTQAELRLEWLDLGGDGPDGWAALGEVWPRCIAAPGAPPLVGRGTASSAPAPSWGLE